VEQALLTLQITTTLQLQLLQLALSAQQVPQDLLDQQGLQGQQV
jgi:hypothetical protein